MRWLAGFSLLFGVWAAALPAQTLNVRSGEHDTFTRLVIRIPVGTEYTIENADNSARLNLANPKLKFDVSKVFSRIGNERLADIKHGNDNNLDMTFSCECEATAFVDARNLLVVDIKSRPDKPATPKVEPLPLVSASANRISRIQSRTVQNDPTLRLPSPETLSATPLQHSSLTEDRLLSELGRAVQQELLVSDIPSDPRLAQVALDQPPSPSGSPSTPKNYAVTTVIDRDLGSALSFSQGGTEPAACYTSDELDIASWGKDQDLSDHLSLLRSKLFQEFDTVDQATALQLAKFYLHFGFGAEAIVILQLDPELAADHPSLVALGRILDDLPTGTENPFRGQQHCTQDVALWALLSESAVESQLATKSLQQTFSRLPPHLRTYLGPRISERLADAGHKASAKAIMRAITRSGKAEAPAVKMVEAKLANLDGDAEAYDAKLKEVIYAPSDSDQAPKALIAVIEKAWESQTSVSAEESELAAAFSLEYRKSDIGPALRNAHLLALGLAGDFDKAFDPDTTDEPATMSPEGIQTLNRLLQLLSDRADDVTFLRHALHETDVRSKHVTIESRSKVAERLIELGFAEPALDVLDRLTSRHIGKQQRLLRAKASLQIRRPHRALLELLDISGPEAAQLRAHALELNGNLQKAAEELLVAGNQDQAARNFWLSNSWDQIPEETQTEYPILATVATKLKSEGDWAGLAPLEQARALLKDSETARGDVSELLSALE